MELNSDLKRCFIFEKWNLVKIVIILKEVKMFKILGRNIKKSMGLFSVFFIIIFCFCILSCFIESLKQNFIVNNEFFSDKFVTFQISNTSNTNIASIDFIKAIKDQPGIIIGKPESIQYKDGSQISGKSIFFNVKCYSNPPIMEGRFFNPKDFDDGQPTAVVGKGLSSLFVKKNNNKYILFNNVYYRVIGIMGYRNKQSTYDNRFILNLDEVIVNDKNFESEIETARWQIDTIKANTKDSLNNIYNELNKNGNKKIQIQIDNSSKKYNPLSDALSAYKTIIIIFIIIGLVVFFSIVNVSLFWVYDMKKEVGVRKALGATNFSIITRIIFKYELIALASFLSALICYSILSSLHIIDLINPFASTSRGLNANLDIISLLAVFIFTIFIGLVTALIPTKQILNMEANDIIRER